MSPITSPTFVRGVETLDTGNKYLNMPLNYAAAIAKTRTDIQNVVDGKYVVAEVNYAFELQIPLAGSVFVQTHKLVEFAKRYLTDKIEDDDTLNLADKWSALSGRPHLLLTREVSLRQ